jgi:hypothetical protein
VAAGVEEYVRQRGSRIGRRGQGSGQLDVREVTGVAVAGVDRVDNLSTAGVHDHACTGVGEDLCHGGAPGPG